MEIVLLVLMVGVFGYAWYVIDKNIKSVETKDEPVAPVVTNRVDVVEVPVVAEPAPAVETPPEVTKARATAKRVKKAAEEIEAPAKVTKVKRQYTKKAKE